MNHCPCYKNNIFFWFSFALYNKDFKRKNHLGFFCQFYVSACIQCIAAMAQSNTAGSKWLPTTIVKKSSLLVSVLLQGFERHRLHQLLTMCCRGHHDWCGPMQGDECHQWLKRSLAWFQPFREVIVLALCVMLAGGWCRASRDCKVFPEIVESTFDNDHWHLVNPQYQ